MGNKIGISFLVAVFTVAALLSTATSVVDSAAAELTTYSDADLAQYYETVKEGEKTIMNCILIIACLISGFLLGRMCSNAYDGLIVLDSRMGRHSVNLNLADEAVSRCRYILLKVVNEDEVGESL